ncbi:MAG: hypothetical protein AAFO99_13950 [Bacteroidota bacterium]
MFLRILSILIVATAKPSESGIWENLIWPVLVSLIIAIGGVLWKKISKGRREKPKVSLKLKIDRKGRVLPYANKRVLVKLNAVKAVLRNEGKNELCIKLIPNYSTWRLNKFLKKELKSKLGNKENELEKKAEILLMKPFLPHESPKGLEDALKVLFFGSFLYTDDLDKKIIDLELWEEKAEISFSICVPENDLSKISEQKQISYRKLYTELGMHKFHIATLFASHSELIYKEIIPKLVLEVYRKHKLHSYDLTKSGWENLYSYYVGIK